MVVYPKFDILMPHFMKVVLLISFLFYFFIFYFFEGDISHFVQRTNNSEGLILGSIWLGVEKWENRKWWKDGKMGG